MDARAVVTKKRDGGELSEGEIRDFLGGYVRGEVPEYQVSALLMAIFLRGMTPAETEHWTRAMIESGETWDWSNLGRATADKHSTGGVGDKVSIPLAPAVAACGVAVPMVSGRGLGHTGGTLDKLESIPGFRTNLSKDEFRRVLEKTGVAFGAQTDELVPADKKLYALRDVTGLIESIPLIASSIMSKKLAEGAGALVLDVKFGSGAFLREPERGAELARTMLGLATRFGRKAVAYQTAMDRPLGITAGHACEIAESIAVLSGATTGHEPVRSLVIQLGGEMLALAGAAPSNAAGRERIQAVLDDGRALEVFRKVVEAQGGEPASVDALHQWNFVQPAPEIVRKEVAAPRAGYCRHRDVRELGWGLCELGGGRKKLGDRIDPLVGLFFAAWPGRRVERGNPVLHYWARRGADTSAAEAHFARAISIEDEPPAATPLVLARLEA